MGKKIIVSAINVVDGGALGILRDAIISFDKVSDDTEITFLVSTCEVHKNISVSKIRFEYFPLSKKSWFFRFFFEYIYFFFYSVYKKPYMWLSLHDTTPNVFAKYRYVYCHNPSMFLKFPIKDIFLDWKQFLFSRFYYYLYKINIKKNHRVIVQQNWMGKEFEKIFNIDNILVAAPNIVENRYEIIADKNRKKDGSFTLFYPSYPRYFKNHNILLKASRLTQHLKIHYVLTISGDENRYIKNLISGYDSKYVDFIGLISKERVFEYYNECDALIFPSLLETWGLPITEFKRFGKPMIVADLPYAHETVGDYENVYWFNPTSEQSLVDALDRVIHIKIPDGPKTYNNNFNKLDGWDSLVCYLLKLMKD